MMDAALASRHELLLASLEAAAARDIVPLFFARFFARWPHAEAMFANPRSSHGTMVNEMLSLLLAQAEGEAWVPMMTRQRVINHYDHGDIPLEQYASSLQILIDTLAEAAGDSWRGEWDAAWRAQAAQLCALIGKGL